MDEQLMNQIISQVRTERVLFVLHRGDVMVLIKVTQTR